MPTNLNNFSSYKSSGRAFPTHISTVTLGTNEKPRGETNAPVSRLNLLRSQLDMFTNAAGGMK